jgi:hypoxanthine phosphoribosyltransferase
LLGVLKGSFVFAADLVRLLDMPLEVEFISLSSYGRGRKESSGKVRVVRGLSTALKGRHVLVVEDIIDAGVTMDFLIAYLRRKGAASIRVCALFDKASRRQVPVHIDYCGLTVPDAFVVGYGLDFDERYRNLPALYLLEE